MNIPKRPRKTKLLVISGIAAVLVFAIGAYLFVQSQSSGDNIKRDKEGISLERSDNEKLETKNIQDNPDDTKTATGSDTVSEAPTGASGLREANVVLTSTGTDNGKVDASAFVSNIVEEGGTCTFVFTQAARTITKTSSTLVNPTSTSCQTISFDETELGNGDWKVTVQYKSATAAGTSNEGILEIK